MSVTVLSRYSPLIRPDESQRGHLACGKRGAILKAFL